MTRKPRIVLPPDQRRAEFIELSEELFRTKGYEATTINDVIAAAGVSKGAFYHHFKAKEDLLEAVVARVGASFLSYLEQKGGDSRPDALSRLNRFLAMVGEWKLENMKPIRRTFEAAVRGKDGMLAARMFEGLLAILSPAIASLIRQGQSEGTIGEGDPSAMTDAILWITYGRERMTGGLLDLAEHDPEALAETLYARLNAEQAIIHRILGVAPGSIRLVGSQEQVRLLVTKWREAALPET